MPSFKLLILTGVAALSLGACEDGREPAAVEREATPATAGTNVVYDNGIESRDLQFHGFTAINLLSGDDVKVTQGPAFLVRVSGRPADLDQLDLRIEYGALLIGRREVPSAQLKRVQFEVTMPAINALTVTGAGDLDVEGITSEAAQLTVAGVGNLKVSELNGTSAKLSITGSGDLDVEGGQVDRADFQVTGSGDLGAENLKARTVRARNTNSGDIEATASGTASIEILGSGDVTIKGGARCTTKAIGSGKARCG